MRTLFGKSEMVIVDQNTIRRRGTGLKAYDPEKAFPGYTLFAPLTGQGEVYLISLEGQIVHQWKLPYPPGLYGYLLPNGNLFYIGKTPLTDTRFSLWPMFKGGIMLEVDRNSNIIWEYQNPDHHHDAHRLRNGNTIVLCVEKIPRELVPQIQGGIPGTEWDGNMYADVIYEVSPCGEIVWTWHAYEHLDPETDVIAPQLHRDEWTHGNTVNELMDGNIMLSFRSISTVIIVDRKTDEINWKLGSDILAQQHCSHELPNGNLLIFDNGTHRRHLPPFSRVIEVNRQTQKIVWEYTDDPPWNFFSPFMSGAQRLPNGNTMIVEGVTGRLFEVTAIGEVVWEYINPFFAHHPYFPRHDILDKSPKYSRGHKNNVFRAFRYAPEEIPWL